MKRQGLNVTVKELRDLADELEMELKEQGIDDLTIGFQINIINNSEKCSDTWHIEE